MKTRILVLVLLLVGLSIAIAEEIKPGPEPAPWWQRVEQTQDLVFRWLTFISLAGGTAITIFVGFYMKFKTELKEAKDRADRASTEKRALQAQVTDLAKQMPPPPPATVVIDSDGAK